MRRRTDSCNVGQYATASVSTSRKPTARYYSAMEVAYNFVAQAGEEIVFLIPDGPTDVTKSERTGVYADVPSSA